MTLAPAPARPLSAPVAAPAHGSAPVTRRHLLAGLAGVGALALIPVGATAATPALYGRGYTAGGY